jgi:hypothetical protein
MWSGNPFALPDFASNHVRDLDDSTVPPMIRARSDISESGPARASRSQSLAYFRAQPGDDVRLFRRQIDVQDHVRHDRLRACQDERDDAVSDAIGAGRLSLLSGRPPCLVEHVGMPGHRDAADRRKELLPGEH